MRETLPTDALPKLGNDVFYDIRVLSAKVNSLLITAKDSPEKAEELLPVCAYNGVLLRRKLSCKPLFRAEFGIF